MPATSKPTVSQLANTVGELQTGMAAILAALQNGSTASEDAPPAAKNGGKPNGKRSRRAETANALGNIDPIQIKSASLSKTFSVYADPRYTRYVSVDEIRNDGTGGRTRRIPTDVLAWLVENADEASAVIDASRAAMAQSAAATDED